MVNNQWQRLRSRIVFLALVILLVVNPSQMSRTSADGGPQGKQGDNHILSWQDVTPVARYRNPADWLVDTGSLSKQKAYGPFPSKTYKVGDLENFIALDFGRTSGPPRRLTAKLMLITPHAYWWFESGINVDPKDLQKAGDRFEKDIYPLDTSLFGEIWTPGIDGDPRVFILHQQQIGSYAVGVFNPRDECPHAICPDSNQHEMLYYGMDYGPVASPQHLTVLAHEYQHLIQYNNDGDEERWLNEGLSQLAEHLNGFNPRNIADSNLRDFLRDPNFQLDSWPDNVANDPSVNYAVSYIFCVYLYQRFGTAFIQHLARSPLKGLASIEESLKAMNTGETLEQVFADWTIANYVNSPYVGNGQYYYQSLNLPSHVIPHILSQASQQFGAVHEYGSEYWQITSGGKYTISFKGSTSVQLTDQKPASGSWMWWSYNEQQGAARLDHDFDLTSATSPELDYNALWDITKDYSAAQVLASEDEGKNWTLLKGTNSSTCNITMMNAPCYVGRSNGWQQEKVDLSPYAGKKIRIRFEYLTNGASSNGLFIDDIAIPAIKYHDDVESLDNGWQAQGFLRVTSDLPQHWAVNVITRDTPPTLIPITLDARNSGKVDVDVPDDGAVVVIAAMAPFVQTSVSYTLNVSKD